MTTATATLDPVTVVDMTTVAERTAPGSSRHPHQIITDIWVRRTGGWRMAGHRAAEA